jgi:hypothetical protein
MTGGVLWLPASFLPFLVDTQLAWKYGALFSLPSGFTGHFHSQYPNITSRSSSVLGFDHPTCSFTM